MAMLMLGLAVPLDLPPVKFALGKTEIIITAWSIHAAMTTNCLQTADLYSSYFWRLNGHSQGVALSPHGGWSLDDAFCVGSLLEGYQSYHESLLS